SVAKGGRIAGVAAAQYRDAAVTGIADHPERGVELRPQAIAYPVADTPPGGAVLDPDPRRGQHRRNRHPLLGDDVEVVVARPVAVVDQIDPGLGGSTGRGRATRVYSDLDVVPVGFVEGGRDFVIGDGLHIAPGGSGDLDQVDAAFALLAG